MAITVSLDVFSGRPNPTWKLTGAQGRELLERLERIDQMTASKPEGVQGFLGYRGYSVRGVLGKKVGALSLYVHAGIVDPGQTSLNLFDADREIEAWLFSSGGKAITGKLRRHVKEQSEFEVHSTVKLVRPRTVACPPCHAADAPSYNPALWNTPAHQPKNNCYNYANDRMTDTFAQPGRATGHMYTSLTCGGVRPAAISDGLRTASNFSTPLPRGGGWYVALVIWPSVDYHWYRQDRNGCWSHKPGQTAVRNVDNSGRKIQDPKTCDRGPYTTSCTYMIADRTVRIR